MVAASNSANLMDKPGVYNQQLSTLAKMRAEMNLLAQASGDFGVHQVKTISATEKLTTSIGKQKLGWGQAVRSIGLYKMAMKEQIALQNAMLSQMTTPVIGKGSADLLIPKTVAPGLQNIRMQYGYINEAIRSVAHQTVNWGKNTQWAGRQIAVGLTMPFLMAGVGAAAAAYQIDKELTRIAKVYDTSAQNYVEAGKKEAAITRELDELRTDSLENSTRLAQEYGASMKDTLGTQAELAATGLKGAELMEATSEVTRIATLGEVDRQTALEMTIALQTAFGLSMEELTEKFNFMNAVENATSLSIADIAEATPRAASALSSLGVTVEEMTILLTAMKEAGVDAEEGSNALKSAVSRIINPSRQAIDEFAKHNIDIVAITQETGGNLFEFLKRISVEMEGLAPLARAQAIGRLFGTWQFNKLNAALNGIGDAMNGVGDQSSQAAMAMQVAKQSTADWATSAAGEIDRFQESASGKFKMAVESFKAELGKLGEPFLDMAAPILNFFTSMISHFNKLSPETKKLALVVLTIGALVGPILMLAGIFANFIGSIVKMITSVGALALRFKIMSADERAMQLATLRAKSAFDAQSSSAAQLTLTLKGLQTQMAATAAASGTMMSTGGLIGSRTVASSGRYAPGSRNDAGKAIGGRFASPADKKLFADMEKSTASIADNSGKTKRNMAGATKAAGTLGIGALAVGMMASGSNEALSNMTNMVFMGAMFMQMLPFAKMGAGVSSVFGAGGTGMLGLLKKIGPQLFNIGKIALRFFGPIGIIAGGILLMKNFVDAQSSAQRQQEELNKSAETWAEILGYAYKESQGPITYEGEESLGQAVDMTKKLREENEGLANALENTEGRQNKMNMALKEGLKVINSGGSPDQAEQAIKTALQTAGFDRQETQVIMMELKAEVDFEDPASIQKAARDQVKAALDASANATDTRSFWNKLFGGNSSAEDASKAAAMDAAATFYNTFGTFSDPQGQAAFFDQFESDIINSSGGMFEQLRSKYADEFEQLGITSMAELSSTLERERANLGTMKPLFDNTDQYQAWNDVANESRELVQRNDAVLRSLIETIGKEEGWNQKRIASIKTLNQLQGALGLSLMNVDTAQRRYNDSVEQAFMKTGRMTDAQQLALLNDYRLKSGLSTTTNIQDQFGEATEKAAESLEDEAEAQEAATKAAEDAADAKADLIAARKDAMTGTQSDIYEEAARLAGEQQEGIINGIQARGEARLDELSRQEEDKESEFDQRQESIDAQAERSREAFDKTAEGQRKSQEDKFEKLQESMQSRHKSAQDSLDDDYERREESLSNKHQARQDAQADLDEKRQEELDEVQRLRQKAADDLNERREEELSKRQEVRQEALVVKYEKLDEAMAASQKRRQDAQDDLAEKRQEELSNKHRAEQDIQDDLNERREEVLDKRQEARSEKLAARHEKLEEDLDASQKRRQDVQDDSAEQRQKALDEVHRQRQEALDDVHERRQDDLEAQQEARGERLALAHEKLEEALDDKHERRQDAQADDEEQRMDALVDRYEKMEESLDDAAEAREDAQSERHRQEDKDLSKRWENLTKVHNDEWEDRYEAEKAAFDARIEAVRQTIEAEEEAEARRQAIFEAEQRRIERMASSFSRNIDFNIALNTGDLDEAAKIAMDANAQTQLWSAEDQRLTQGDESETRKEALNAKIEQIELERDARIKALELVEEKEKEAFDVRQELAEEEQRLRHKREDKALRDSLDLERKNFQDRREMEVEQLEDIFEREQDKIDKQNEMESKALENRIKLEEKELRLRGEREDKALREQQERELRDAEVRRGLENEKLEELLEREQIKIDEINKMESKQLQVKMKREQDEVRLRGELEDKALADQQERESRAIEVRRAAETKELEDLLEREQYKIDQQNAMESKQLEARRKREEEGLRLRGERENKALTEQQEKEALAAEARNKLEQKGLDDKAERESRAIAAKNERETKALADERDRENERLAGQNAAESKQLEDRKDREDDRLANFIDDQIKALEAEKKRLDKGLSNERETYGKRMAGTKEHEQERTRLGVKSAEDSYESRKRGLEKELEELRAFIPRNAAEMEAHRVKVEEIYRKYGINLKTQGDEWGGIVGRSLSTNVRRASNTMKNDINWRGVGKHMTDEMAANFDINSGQLLDWLKTGVFPGAKGRGKARMYEWEARHEGGGFSSKDRTGVPRSASPYPSEVPALLKRNEFVVNEKATRANLPFLQTINSGGGADNVGPMIARHAGGITGIAGGAIAAAVGKAVSQGIGSQLQMSMDSMLIAGSSFGPAKEGKYGGTRLNDDQLFNASTIMNVGKQMGASNRDLIIALMTAMQESGLKNINYGDRDSVGLFQQRPSQGWGTVQQIMDPNYSASQFFKRLLKIEGRGNMPLTVGAQKVQRSAFPNAYAKWEEMARAIIQGSPATYGEGGQSGSGSFDSRGGWPAARNGVISPNTAAARSYIRQRWPSTNNGGDASLNRGDPTSDHGRGKALDIFPGSRLGEYARGGDLQQGWQIANWFAQNPDRFGSKYIIWQKLINSGSGWRGYSNKYGSGPTLDHYDHVHLSVKHAGGLQNAMEQEGLPPRGVRMPQLATGGSIKYDNVIANLHKNETVLTEPLSRQLERGIGKIDSGGGMVYDIDVDLRGSYIKEDVDIKKAVYAAIDERETRQGRSRVVSR